MYGYVNNPYHIFHSIDVQHDSIQRNIMGCMQDYESYDKSKLENTTEEDVQTKVRLTALMTLGTRSTHELKFTEVQQALGLGSDGEVEAWVVRAIGKVSN